MPIKSGHRKLRHEDSSEFNQPDLHNKIPSQKIIKNLKLKKLNRGGIYLPMKFTLKIRDNSRTEPNAMKVFSCHAYYLDTRNVLYL